MSRHVDDLPARVQNILCQHFNPVAGEPFIEPTEELIRAAIESGSLSGSTRGMGRGWETLLLWLVIKDGGYPAKANGRWKFDPYTGERLIRGPLKEWKERSKQSQPTEIQ